MENRLFGSFQEVAMDNGKVTPELEKREQERVALGLLMTLGDFVLKHKRDLGELIRWLQVPISSEDFVHLLDAPRAVAAKVVEKVEAALLTMVSTIAVPAMSAVGKASDLFVVNISDTARVKISYVDPDFTRLFGKMAVGVYSDSTVSNFTLTRNAYDRDIRSSLGGEEKVETSLDVIWWLLLQQPKGLASPDGALLTNGNANIFYVRKPGSSALCAVGVSWFGCGGYVRVCELDDYYWSGSRRVFAPASVVGVRNS